MAKYTEERMFGMLADINRSEKRNAYKKYDLPTFKTGSLDIYADGGYTGTKGDTKIVTDKEGNTTTTYTKADGTRYIKVETADGKVYNKTLQAIKPMSRDEFMQTDYYNQRNQFPIMNQKSETLQNSAAQTGLKTDPLSVALRNKASQEYHTVREELIPMMAHKTGMSEDDARRAVYNIDTDVDALYSKYISPNAGRPDAIKKFVPRAEQSFGDRVTDIAFNPMTVAGHLMRGQAVPEYLQESLDNGTYGYWSNGTWHTERNPLDVVTDLATPIGSIHAAKNIVDKATDDVDGNFWTTETAMDAMIAAPGVRFLNRGINNAYKVNPWAGKLNKYNRVVGKDAVDDIVETGLIRTPQNTRTNTGTGINLTRKGTTPYPSFGEGVPNISENVYAQNIINNGGTPYVISTDAPMGVSTLGRHGKGSTLFPVDAQGNYLKNFSAADAKVFEANPHWLKGYQEVPLENRVIRQPGDPKFEASVEPMSKFSQNFAALTNVNDVPDLKDFSRDNTKFYEKVKKEEMDKFLKENPDKQIEFAKQDVWPGHYINDEGVLMNYDPLFQNRNLQKAEFDEATQFGMRWAIKDPEGYQKVADKVSELNKRQSAINNKVSDLHKNIVDIKRTWVNDYLAKNNIERTYDDLIDEFLYTDNAEETLYHEVSKLYNAEMASLRPPERDKLFEELQNQNNKLSRIDNQVATAEKEAEQFMDPTFKRKVEIIYDAAGKPMPTNTNVVDIKNRSALIYGSEGEQSFMDLPKYEQEILRKKWDNINGVRTDNKTITLGSRPDESVYLLERTQPIFKNITYEKYPFEFSKPSTWKNALKRSETGTKLVNDPDALLEINPIQVDKQSMLNPKKVGETQVHEVGHDLQRLYGNWSDNLDEYSLDLLYSTAHGNNPLSKEFKDAMVEPSAPVPNPMVPGEMMSSNDTWLSSVKELHSELMKARLQAAKYFMGKKYSDGPVTMEEAIQGIKKLEAEGDENLFNFYLNPKEGNLSKHFKSTTSEAIKKELIKILPVVIPATAVGVGMASGDEESPKQKYGGNINNLSKFIKK